MLNASFIKRYRILFIFAFCITCININVYSNSDYILIPNSITAVKHQELLNVLAEAEKSQNKTLFIKIFKDFPDRDKLETIAYTLEEGLYPDITIQMIRSDSILRDKRLVEYFPNTLKKYKDNGPVLYSIVRIIREFFPDPNLVPAVLEYAGDSDYYTHDMYPSPFGTGEHSYNSVFEEIEGILRKVTNGKIPGERISDMIVLEMPLPLKPGEISPRESYIKKWKEQWPQVQKELLEEQRELQMEILPVLHQEILDSLAQIDKALNEKEFDRIDGLVNKFSSYPRNHKLETIAYALMKDMNKGSIASAVRKDKESRDQRLVPYIEQAIHDSLGQELLANVQIAQFIPSPDLLPVLLNHALSNDYVAFYDEGRPIWFKYDVLGNSVFFETAEALYEITNGKIGHSLTEISYENLYRQKESLIQKWRNIWQEELCMSYPIKPVAHQELLDILKNTKDLSRYPKFFNYPASQKFETIAYCLKEGLYTDSVITIIYYDEYLKDKRLAEYFTGTIEKTSDNDALLFNVVELINRYFPELVLVPILLEHTIENDYNWRLPSFEFTNYSIFEESAEAIYKATNGRIGLEHTEHGRTFQTEEKQLYIQNWRTIWKNEFSNDKSAETEQGIQEHFLGPPLRR